MSMINNAIQQFVNNIGCIFLSNPRPDIKCGQVFMEMSELVNRHSIGRLDGLLKPKEQHTGDFNIGKLVSELSKMES